MSFVIQLEREVVNSMVDVFSQWIGLYSTFNREALLTNFFDVLLRCPWGCLVAAKKHIVKIQKKKFSIGSGAESNPLTEDLHHAVHISRLSCITKIFTSSCSLGSALYCFLLSANSISHFSCCLLFSWGGAQGEGAGWPKDDYYFLL